MARYVSYGGGGNHRNTSWTKAWYKPGDEGWEINGIEYCIAKLFGDDRFWAVPADNSNEAECEDIGPSKTLKSAAVALTLMK